METVQQQFDRLNRTGWPCAYRGDRGDWLMFIGRTRDSGLLENSNFDAALKALEAIDSDGVAVESASHWACGWVENILIDPSKPALVQEAEEMEAALADYPVLDESDYSERERELFPRIREVACRKYADPSDYDVEIDGAISKSGDHGFWVSARVYVRLSEAEALAQKRA